MVLQREEIEGTEEKRPINILSWLSRRVTAIEMLRYHKTDKFTSLIFNSH